MKTIRNLIGIIAITAITAFASAQTVPTTATTTKSIVEFVSGTDFSAGTLTANIIVGTGVSEEELVSLANANGKNYVRASVDETKVIIATYGETRLAERIREVKEKSGVSSIVMTAVVSSATKQVRVTDKMRQNSISSTTIGASDGSVSIPTTNFVRTEQSLKIGDITVTLYRVKIMPTALNELEKHGFRQATPAETDLWIGKFGKDSLNGDGRLLVELKSMASTTQKEVGAIGSSGGTN